MKNLAVYVLVALGVVAYNVSTDADRDGAGAIVSEGSVNAFQLRVGDCFDDTYAAFGDEVSEVDSLPGVPCSSPHDNEVYAAFDIDLSEFPDEDELSMLAFDRCLDRFENFVGRDYDSSDLDILTLYPSQESWNLQNDREIVCALYDMNTNKLTGSARASGL
jgi:hypothetical protein